MGKKRANQPGYVEKVNSRGHKYWARVSSVKGDDDRLKPVETPHAVHRMLGFLLDKEENGWGERKHTVSDYAVNEESGVTYHPGLERRVHDDDFDDKYHKYDTYFAIPPSIDIDDKVHFLNSIPYGMSGSQIDEDDISDIVNDPEAMRKLSLIGFFNGSNWEPHIRSDYYSEYVSGWEFTPNERGRRLLVDGELSGGERHILDDSSASERVRIANSVSSNRLELEHGVFDVGNGFKMTDGVYIKNINGDEYHQNDIYYSEPPELVIVDEEAFAQHIVDKMCFKVSANPSSLSPDDDRVFYCLQETGYLNASNWKCDVTRGYYGDKLSDLYVTFDESKFKDLLEKEGLLGP